ncbi:MAG: hypothetical protein K1X63_11765 [Chitinophagales bacterium]|nr:hypothetical protein [Chitinophagales bacterium]
MKLINLTLSYLFVSSISFAQELEKTSITNGTFVASSFISDNEGWLADNNGKIWHMANGGQSWDSINVEQSFSRLNFTDELNGFGVSANTLYKSVNGGHTWTVIDIPENVLIKTIFFLDGSNGFLGSYQKIYRTIDGGGSWSVFDIENISVNDFYFTGNSIGIAVGRDDELNRCVWRTSDGGETWENVFNEENYYMNSVYFISENIGWAAGYYDRAGIMEPAIIKTTDGGVTWQENYRYTGISSDGETLTDIRFKNELEGYALSVHNYDLYTTDGGETWNLVNDSEIMSETPVFGLYKTLAGHAHLYLAGKSGTVDIWK